MAAKDNVVAMPRTLGLADLKRSGLDAGDAKKLGIEFLAGDDVLALMKHYGGPAYKIPYYHANGRPSGAFRLKLLQEFRYFGQEKVVRYWQPAETPPTIYLPPLIDWEAAFKDPKVELWITEGEKKAAAAGKAGIACLGLGGVWSWRSTKKKQALVPELKEIQWQGRVVKLCFDAEGEPKPQVSGALEALGAVLMRLGATVVTVPLPLLKGQDKTGLDDFLVARGAQALAEIEVAPLHAHERLARLNEELLVVDRPMGVLCLETGQFFKKGRDLAEVMYADQVVDVIDRAGRLVEANAVSEWLKWPKRRRASGIAYEPGQATTLEDGRHNLWKSPGIVPKRGDVSLWLKLLDHVFAGAKEEERRWFERWAAYPFQHLGTKLYSAVVVWTKVQGAGKSLVGEQLGQLYGENFSRVTEGMLHSSFNAWQRHKQFVLGEEVTGSDRRSEADKLKHLITGPVVTINQKYEASYDIRNTVNYYFTSNHPDAFLLDNEDRRYFVHEIRSGKLDLGVARRYDEWYRTPEARAAMLYWMERVDLGNFDPRTPAPQTAAHAAMAELSGTEIDGLAQRLLEAPDVVLRVGEAPMPRDLYTLEELVQVLDPDRRYGAGPKKLARSLRRLGLDAMPTKVGASALKLWAVRNREKWARADHAARVAHYAGTPEGEKKERRPKY